MILAGDVGGTKTILALFDVDGDEVKCLKKEQFSSAHYPTFTELLATFLTDADGPQITAVCIGVAGIVINGRCETTNLPWVLSSKEIGERVNSQNVWLFNDLEATAWGLLDLPEPNFVELNPDAQLKQGNIAVVAAGTGAVRLWVVQAVGKKALAAKDFLLGHRVEGMRLGGPWDEAH